MTKKNHPRRRNEKHSGDDRSPTDIRKKFKYDYSKDYADKSWPYHHGKMDRGAKILLIVFPIFVATAISYVYYNAKLREQVRTPLDEPKIISLSSTSAIENSEKFWGSYRSNVYFGMKTRSKQSPVLGLMWFTQNTGEMPPPIRHWCEQGELDMYGWFVHDGANFGIQQLVDKYYSISNDFVKRPGGSHGGDWSARFRVKPKTGAEAAVISLVFYMALDGQGHIEPEVKGNRLLGITGFSEELGNFKVKFPKPHSDKSKFNYFVTKHKGLDKLKEKLFEGMSIQQWEKEGQANYIGLRGPVMPEGVSFSEADYIAFQVTTSLPVDMEVLFESDSNTARTEPLAGAVYQAEIQKHLVKFDEKFNNLFKLEEKGYSTEDIGFAKATLSNMIGSIGYFYGQSIVRSKYTDKEPLLYPAAPLYTGVPSRSFFPRGFLWDEGFHNLLIRQWDQEISEEIIGHWLDLMNTEGWIPREQILGVEARAKVPDEFIVQHNENANPPTLFLPLVDIVNDLIHSDDPKDKTYLKHLFPRLRTWYNWFNTSQNGELRSSYRWRGRNPNAIKELNPKTLTSGLDDYPRASHPTDIERHLDLRCWIALASGVLADIAQTLNESWVDFKETHDMLTDNRLLDELHWSPSAERYSDYGLHTDSVKLERPKPKQPAPGQRQPPPRDKERVVKKAPVPQFVDTTFGYNSLFPFLLEIIEPDSIKLGKVLKDLQDPNLLWTKFGLRSLAKNSPLYKKHNTEHDPPYWRGNIWINMNYLAIRALYSYSKKVGPYQEHAQSIYHDLRSNVITNIMKQYRSTGYVWENYNDGTGKGQGAHPFTGWSGLVVAMMAESYH